MYTKQSKSIISSKSIDYANNTTNFLKEQFNSGNLEYGKHLYQ